MGVTLYQSTDLSAPTLSGTAGDLVNVLDKCLRAGYGSKSGAGWTKPYTGTNGAVFKQGGGNGFYLYVNDNAPVSAKSARVRGYEVMDSFSDTPSGTIRGPFPNATQQANTGVRKSNTADATLRDWIVVADNKTFYLFVRAGDTTNVWQAMAFGHFYSFLPSDNFCTMIVSRASGNEDSSSSTADTLQVTASTNSPFAGTSGHYMARDYTGLGGPQDWAAVVPQTAISGQQVVGVGGFRYPNPTDTAGGGKIMLARIFMQGSGSGVGGVNHRRGFLRGLWHFGHPVANVSHGDFLTGTGSLAGKTFMVVKFGAGSGCYVVEVSDTWESN